MSGIFFCLLRSACSVYFLFLSYLLPAGQMHDGWKIFSEFLHSFFFARMNQFLMRDLLRMNLRSEWKDYLSHLLLSLMTCRRNFFFPQWRHIKIFATHFNIKYFGGKWQKCVCVLELFPFHSWKNAQKFKCFRVQFIRGICT